MDQYLALVVMAVLAVGFVLLSITTARMLGTSRPTPAKDAPYESGIIPTREPPERFPVRFYLVAMIFIIFDIEIVFLYPYAVVYRRLGSFGLFEIVAFAVAVFVSFLYLVSQGALDWGPVKRQRAGGSPATDPGRTSETTIRRVGLDGRELAEQSAERTGTAA